MSTHRVTLPILDDITLTAACAQILTDARARMATLAALPLESVTPETLLDVWDDESIRLENIAGPIAILNNVHPDKIGARRGGCVDARARDVHDGAVPERSAVRAGARAWSRAPRRSASSGRT